MDTEYLSLSAVAKKLQVHELLPVPIQGTLRRSLWITMAINVICIPILYVLPSWIASIGLERSAFYILFTADLANFAFRLGYELSPVLLALNIISFTMSAVVLYSSRFMTRPVSEPFHWMAGVGAFPSGISAITVLALATFLLAVIIIAIVIWLIIIAIIGWILSILFRCLIEML